MGLPGAPRMQVFPLSYPRGSAPMRIIAFITEAGSIQVSSNTAVSPPPAPPEVRPIGRGTSIHANAIRSLGVSPYPNMSSTSG